RLLALQLHIHVSRPVRVRLDRKPRPLDAERREKLDLALVRSPLRNDLLHPPEDDPAVFAFQLDRYDTEPRLQADTIAIARLRDDECASEHRVPRERQLASRCEDADADVALPLRGQDKDR